MQPFRRLFAAVAVALALLTAAAGAFAAECSDYLELKLLDHVFGKATYTSPSIYFALCTAAVSDSDTGTTITECNYTGYARVSVAGSSFDVAASRSITTNADVTFGACTAGSNTATYLAICDASTAGNLLAFTPLDASLAISSGVTPKITAGNVTVTFSNSISQYLANELLDHVFKAAAYTAPTNIYVALATASVSPTTTGTTITEAAYTSYARVSTSATDWDAASAGLTDNANAITFPAATGGSETETHWALADAATNGNLLFYGALDAGLAVSSGITPEFAAGDCNHTLD